MTDFAEKVIRWYRQHGRHDLPWQKNPTPYRVWVSEIMLQQTQVSTVIPYFERFIAQFPRVEVLAHADEDAVLNLWTGLGYYARARNLLKAAKLINEQPTFPNTVTALEQLPGIGRSTAGAIVSLSTINQPAPILDGNVKRVLTRYLAFEGVLAETKAHKDLWLEIEKVTPTNNTQAFNQAMMDLGAGICTRTNPNCRLCPLKKNCHAHQAGNETSYPRRNQKKKALPQREITLAIYQNPQGQVLLIKRPSFGIWGGLWSFPEMPTCWPPHTQTLKSFNHIFSHFKLTIHPVLAFIDKITLSEHQTTHWHTPGQSPLPGGIPTPIQKLLTQLSDN